MFPQIKNMPPRRAIIEINEKGEVINRFVSVVSLLRSVNLNPTSGARVCYAIKNKTKFQNRMFRYNLYEPKHDEVFVYMPDYQLEISNYGNARMKNGYTTPGSKIGDYYRLCLGKKRGNPAIHVLVAKAFIPNPDNKPTVNHIVKVRDGGSNHVSNLEWMTHKEQCVHRDKDLPL